MKYFPKASKKSMCVSHVQNSSFIFLDFSRFLIWSLLFWICFFLTLLRSCPYCFYSICHLWVFSSRTHSSVRRLSMTFPNLQTEESDFDHCLQFIIPCSAVLCSQAKYRHLQSRQWQRIWTNAGISLCWGLHGWEWVSLHLPCRARHNTTWLMDTERKQCRRLSLDKALPCTGFKYERLICNTDNGMFSKT